MQPVDDIPQQADNRPAATCANLAVYKKEINCQKAGYYLRAKGCVSDRSKAEDYIKFIPDEDEQDVITDESSLHFRNSMVVLKGEFDLITDHNEDKIRQDLVDVFKRKLPLIGKNDFEFVKRETQCIVRPVVKHRYKGDFRHVKNLCGQGRLYVQLHGQVRAVCSRPVVSLLWNVVVRPHLRCVRAACCGLSSHGCYSLSSDLPQNCCDRTAAALLETDLLQTGVTELQQCCCGQNCSRL